MPLPTPFKHDWYGVTLPNGKYLGDYFCYNSYLDFANSVNLLASLSNQKGVDLVEPLFPTQNIGNEVAPGDFIPYIAMTDLVSNLKIIARSVGQEFSCRHQFLENDQFLTFEELNYLAHKMDDLYDYMVQIPTTLNDVNGQLFRNAISDLGPGVERIQYLRENPLPTDTDVSLLQDRSIGISIDSTETVITIRSLSEKIKFKGEDLSPNDDRGGLAMGAFAFLPWLIDISGLAHFDVSEVTCMMALFFDARSLTDLTPIYGWDVSRVTNMRSFMACKRQAYMDLSSVDLSSWDLSVNCDFTNSFDGVNLTSAYAKTQGICDALNASSGNTGVPFTVKQ